ncbi:MULTISPECIES: LysR family transcriptional regulator [unclassified Pantoea]|uniref:LysR family transcriptional regulator n=1 Tax=unclassified Pantoea TaxID=2630326 RepID=UPI00301D938A
MERLSWDDLRILLAIQRHGSLLAAGKALRISTSTTARRLDSLEAAAGRQLVHRHQSGTTLNQEALRLVHLADQFESGLAALERDQNQMAGTIRLSAPGGMVPTLAGALLSFQREHPRISIELVGESRAADVASREADMAVRLMASDSGNLIEHVLGELRFGLFGCPDYLSRHLPSRRLCEKKASELSFVGLEEKWKHLPHEQWLRKLGAKSFVFRSDSVEALAEAVRSGAGLGAFALTDPRITDLKPVETVTEAPGQLCYLVWHAELRAVPHVRAAVEAVRTYFNQHL